MEQKSAQAWEASMARLEGKIAIVTGGAKGIGRHYSQALAAEGARAMAPTAWRA
jgi:NAD(P)-dependent dehydrogenase (short-subunit alcohol dehydrogenase family)